MNQEGSLELDLTDDRHSKPIIDVDDTDHNNKEQPEEVKDAHVSHKEQVLIEQEELGGEEYVPDYSQ